jgi:hypothetical protein
MQGTHIIRGVGIDQDLSELPEPAQRVMRVARIALPEIDAVIDGMMPCSKGAILDCLTSILVTLMHSSVTSIFSPDEEARALAELHRRIDTALHQVRM